ncbi:MAG TPA: hypothetical protein VJ553_00305 [Candidatus Paceibacterota bacterium]|nr:hypothetical protein [Candidatus Paceibacterota bacterium]
MATEIRITPARVVRAGIAAAYTTGVVAATSTYVMKNDGRTIFRFYKTGVNACVVTFTAQNAQGLVVTGAVVTVPATTGDVFCGPFEKDRFNDAFGDLRFSLSEATAIFFEALTLG